VDPRAEPGHRAACSPPGPPAGRRWWGRRTRGRGGGAGNERGWDDEHGEGDHARRLARRGACAGRGVALVETDAVVASRLSRRAQSSRSWRPPPRPRPSRQARREACDPWTTRSRLILRGGAATAGPNPGSLPPCLLYLQSFSATLLSLSAFLSLSLFVFLSPYLFLLSHSLCLLSSSPLLLFFSSLSGEGKRECMRVSENDRVRENERIRENERE